MCDVSVAWKEGQGLITEVTRSVEKVRACWGISSHGRRQSAATQHLPLVKALSPVLTQSTHSQTVRDSPKSLLVGRPVSEPAGGLCRATPTSDRTQHFDWR